MRLERFFVTLILNTNYTILVSDYELLLELPNLVLKKW